MKLTFLGTSHGVPSKDKYCSCCMIEVGQSIYFVDAGAPVVDELLRMDKDMDDVKAFFTTHSHGDHTNGLFNICHLFNWFYRSTSIDVFFTEERFCNVFDEMLTCMNSSVPICRDRIRLQVASAGVVYEDENIRVTYFPTAHMDAYGLPAYGILIEAEGRRVLFSGDCSNRLAAHDLPPMLETLPVDIFVCELAHFRIDECCEFLERSLASQIIMTHVVEGHMEALLDYAGRSDKPIIAAYDRLEVNLN